MAAIIEVEFFNSYWMKKIVVEQNKAQLQIQQNQGGDPPVTKLEFNWQQQVPGSGSSPARGVWPLSNCYAPPQTFKPNFTSTDQTVNEPDFRAALKPNNWYIEESSIKGGFNNMETDIGARAFLDEEEPIQQHRFNSLIYSGVFNSRTGINRTNEFPVGTSITKSANPEYGSIQKTYAEETNLLILQENKCQRALIDKDTIYTSEGGTQTLPQGVVIGQITPYAGEYGISKNPESFSIYGYQKYFIDRNRNAVLRLSKDGITEISEYGMRDWFRDNLAPLNDNITNTNILEVEQITMVNDTSFIELSNIVYAEPAIQNTFVGSAVYFSDDGTTWEQAIGDNGSPVTVTGSQGSSPFTIFLSDKCSDIFDNQENGIQFISKNRSYIKGGWDVYNKQYICSLHYNYSTRSKVLSDGTFTADPKDYTFYTLGFDEKINGWTSFYSYRPGLIGSLKSKFYSANNFYDTWNNGIGEFSLYEHYKEEINTPNRGVFYGKSYPATVTIIANALPSVEKNFLAIDYEGSSGWKVVQKDNKPSIFSDETGANFFGTEWRDQIDDANEIYSYYEGRYDGIGGEGSAADPNYPPLLHAGFDRKNNRYMANLVRPATSTNRTVVPGEVIYGDQMSGIKGYFATITLSTDTETDPLEMKELYQVSLTYVTR